MLLAGVVLLLASSPPDPWYDMKFVELPDIVLYDQHRILDATRDLYLVGYTYTRVQNREPTSPVLVVAGQPVRQRVVRYANGSTSQLWPYSVGSGGRMRALRSTYPSFEKPDKLDAWLEGRITSRGWVTLGTTKGYKRFHRRDGGGHGQGVVFDRLPDWARKHVGERSPAGFVDGAIGRFRHSQNGQAVNLTFTPFTPGPKQGMRGTRQIAPFAKFEGDHWMPLESVVESSRGFDFREVVWLDKAGWMVVRTRLGKRDGFAWLYPKKP